MIRLLSSLLELIYGSPRDPLVVEGIPSRNYGNDCKCNGVVRWCGLASCGCSLKKVLAGRPGTKHIYTTTVTDRSIIIMFLEWFLALSYFFSAFKTIRNCTEKSLL